MCRFDLLHVMIDEPDEDMDRAVANHIVKVHQRRERAFNVPYSMGQVQRYIKYARAITPRMTPQVLLPLLPVCKHASIHMTTVAFCVHGAHGAQQHAPCANCINAVIDHFCSCPSCHADQVSH